MFVSTLKEDQLAELLEDTEAPSGSVIVLYNDDLNTFDWVIHCLVKYCKHHSEQAEQCAWLVHTSGKCVVKKGSYSDLHPICKSLQECGLSAEVQTS